MSKIVLALVPHPDDAEFYAGGTLARMAAEGVRVLIAIATDGRRGSFHCDSETLARIRAEEAQQAADVLGAAPPILLNHPDLELDRLPPGTLREEFIRLIRRYRPDIVIAQDPFAPFEVHPDHRATAWAAAEAINYATLPLMHPEHLAEGLEPHFVVEKYFYRESVAGANRIVDISATIERKLAALAAHGSQVEFLVEDVMRQARLAGIDAAALMGESARSPLSALAWAMRSQAAEIGKAVGAPFGEAFRYVRFDPLIEGLLAAHAPGN